MKINFIQIQDFKVLHDVRFEPGKVNVLIGSNGSGKTSVLEAIGLLSLAMTDRIDDNSLQRKGVRLSRGSFYKTSLYQYPKSQMIRMHIGWEEQGDFDYSLGLYTPSDNNEWRINSEALEINGSKVWGRSHRSQTSYDNSVGMIMLEPDEKLYPVRPSANLLRQFAIYQPSTPFLRGTPDPLQAIPLGLNGGRLAEAVEELIHDMNGEIVFGNRPIDGFLELLEWADGIDVSFPNKSNLNAAVPTSRRVLEVHDVWMKQNDRLTAYDVSEGALYVLFLLTLALHEKAPRIFAIDNFDQALNPRLAKAVTRLFCDIILDSGKTAFLTTHNPLVLDGLDLTNDDIRLFAVERKSRTGEACVRRIKITDNPAETDIPLSRLWPMGVIGGVPVI